MVEKDRSGMGHQKRTKVLCAVPTRGQIFSGTVFFLVHQALKGHSIYLQPSTLAVEGGRRQILDYFIKDREFTHLYWCDDDVTPSMNAVDQLLDYDKDVVVANYPLYFDGSIGSSAYYFAKDKTWQRYPLNTTGFKEIRATGLGACLMKRWVCEKLKAIPSAFTVTFKNDGNIFNTDDMTMCKFLRFLKIPIWCDFDIKCDHHKMNSLRGIAKDFLKEEELDEIKEAEPLRVL